MPSLDWLWLLCVTLPSYRFTARDCSGQAAGIPGQAADPPVPKPTATGQDWQTPGRTCNFKKYLHGWYDPGFELLRFVDWKTQKRSRTQKGNGNQKYFLSYLHIQRSNSLGAPTVLALLDCRWLVWCLLLPQTCIFEAEGHLGARVMSAFVFPLATIARALTSTFIGSSYIELCCFHYNILQPLGFEVHVLML